MKLALVRVFSCKHPLRINVRIFQKALQPGQNLLNKILLSNNEALLKKSKDASL